VFQEREIPGRVRNGRSRHEQRQQDSPSETQEDEHSQAETWDETRLGIHLPPSLPTDPRPTRGSRDGEEDEKPDHRESIVVEK
jgi:hypothetical protein